MKPIIRSFIAALGAVLVLAVGFLAAPMLMPSAGYAQDERVTKSMAILKGETAYLGAPKIEGKDPVGGKDAPALYFGSTKMNNNSDVVDRARGKAEKEWRRRYS
jgi:hypothetical protein